MKVTSVPLLNINKKAVNAILDASKNKQLTIGQQMVMANYYGHLHMKPNSDLVDFAKIMCLK